MEVRRINTTEIVDVGRSALEKVRQDDIETISNITLCISKLTTKCRETGVRLAVSDTEFFDFIGEITDYVRRKELVLAFTIPLNASVEMLSRIRRLCDNSAGSIMNVERMLRSGALIYAAELKEDSRGEYAIDYATRLLERAARN